MTEANTKAKTEDLTQPTARREIWFESDGTRLFALELGRGAPVVFLHGGLADHRAALFRVARLSSTHRLLCPDLRGSGRSIHAGPLNWDRLADDLAALLDHLQIERAVIGGTSMGSAVALRFALRHPLRLNGLILMSPLYPGADRPLTDAATTAMRVMSEAGQRALQHGIESLAPLFEGLPQPVRDIALEMMRSFDAASVAATTRFLARCEQPLGSASELGSIDVPTLLIPGVDAQHPAEIASLYAQHLRQPLLVEPSDPDLLQKLAHFCGRRG